MTSILSLVPDIYSLASKGIDSATGEHNVTINYDKWFEERGPRKPKTLHFSEVGSPCLRKLWYNINNPGAAEDIGPTTRIKFLYGDMLEELVLSLAKAAGHTVERQQERVVYDVGHGWQITGRIDAVIDGVVVDVKSTTKFGVNKFEGGLVDDPFGYYQQLNGYAVALDSRDAGFLTIQKELGHVAYFPIEVNKEKFVECAENAVLAVEGEINHIPVVPPVPQSSTSKNMKLDTLCSYCSYKKECFPLVRTFLYSNGPVYLTTVVDTPKVMEVV